MKSIKSVNIRPNDIKRQLLMSFSMVDAFQSFLKNSLGKEVVVLNTNIGMEVYYYDDVDYSSFIKESVLLYTIRHFDHSKMMFSSYLSKEEVCQKFCEGLFIFSHHPQVFLAYFKKLRHIQKKNASSQFVIPILNEFLEEGLRRLIETGIVPHYEKIKKATIKPQKSITQDEIARELISEVLLKRHLN